RIIGSAQYLAEHLGEVPVHVIPCALSRLPADADTATVAGTYGSILPAAWNFMLALRSRGLGSAWTTLHLVYEKEAAELLGIPDSRTTSASPRWAVRMATSPAKVASVLSTITAIDRSGINSAHTKSGVGSVALTGSHRPPSTRLMSTSPS